MLELAPGLELEPVRSAEVAGEDAGELGCSGGVGASGLATFSSLSMTTMKGRSTQSSGTIGAAIASLPCPLVLRLCRDFLKWLSSGSEICPILSEVRRQRVLRGRNAEAEERCAGRKLRGEVLGGCRRVRIGPDEELYSPIHPVFAADESSSPQKRRLGSLYQAIASMFDEAAFCRRPSLVSGIDSMAGSRECQRGRPVWAPATPCSCSL